MQENTKKIAKAALNLSEVERVELIKTLTDYNKVTLNEQRNFSEAFNKSLGPINTGNCPVCGK